MSLDRPHSTFDRLRCSRALRALVVVVAILGSQNSLACALEDMSPPDTAAVEMTAAGEHSPDTEDLCTMCVGCAFCGSGCSFAASPRTDASFFELAPVRYAKVILITAAPQAWTPPTLLRPPTRVN